MDLVSIVLLWK